MTLQGAYRLQGPFLLIGHPKFPDLFCFGLLKLRCIPAHMPFTMETVGMPVDLLIFCIVFQLFKTDRNSIREQNRIKRNGTHKTYWGQYPPFVRPSVHPLIPTTPVHSIFIGTFLQGSPHSRSHGDHL